MEEASRTNKRLIIAVAVVAVVAFAAIGVRALVASAFGGPMEALEAIPRDVDAVFVLDLADARDLADSELIEYAVRAAQEAGELPSGDPGDALVEQLESELGLSFEDDILSWIGRSFAVGFGGDLNEGEPTTIVAAMTIRNEAEAWDFVEVAIDRTIEEDPTVIVTETTTGDRRIIVVESVGEQAHVTIHGDHLILANSGRSLTSSINALDRGTSVLDTAWLAAADAAIPERSLFKAMLDPALINTALDDIAEFAGEVGAVPETEFVAMGMGMGLDGNQISFDFFVEQAEPIDSQGVGPLPLDRLATLANTPDFVLGMALPDDFGQRILNEMDRTEPGLLRDMRESLESEFGFDPTDALAQLGGHMWFSAAASDFEAVGTFGMVMGLADPAPVLRLLDDVASVLGNEGVVVRSQPGLLEVPEIDLIVEVDEELRLTMDSGGANSQPFAASAGFDWLSDNFGDSVVFYMDVYALMTSEQLGLPPEDVEDLEAFRVGASFDTDGNAVTISALIEIDLSDGAVALGR